MPARHTSHVHLFAPAAAGTRVRVMTLIAFVVTVVTTAIVAIITGLKHNPDAMLATLVVAGGVPLIGVIWFLSRIRAYAIEDGVLRIVRPLCTATFSFVGLTSVVADREALAGARKLIGNDGLGAITGRFRSRKLGKFQAFVTDGDRAVVLRWPDRCLVVSPEKPELFINALHRLGAGKGGG